MKNRFLWASAVALAVTVGSQVQTMGLTNGLIIITTRTASDALYRQISSSGLYDADDFRGPGTATPGDSAMASLLMDNGYSTRLVPEWLLSSLAVDPSGVYSAYMPCYEYIYGGGGGPTKPLDTNELYAAQLVILSGSGSGGDFPEPNTRGIAIMVGDHTILGDRANKGSLFMYGNTGTSDANGANAFPVPGPIQWMKLTAAGKAHPIMAGIPLDAQDRVKIYRDRYPEENAHVPAGGKANYQFYIPFVNVTVSTVPSGTTVLGVRDVNNDQACFSVADIGGLDSQGNANTQRKVHIFINEGGSGDSRRVFNALSDIGRVIFLRACKWAMGETLTPYVPLGLIQTTLVSPNKIKLEWTGAATKNYKVLGTANLLGASDFSNWQTVVQDIAGVDPGVGPTSVKLDISNGPQYAFLRVTPVP
jgi:hypothetical protein